MVETDEQPYRSPNRRHDWQFFYHFVAHGVHYSRTTALFRHAPPASGPDRNLANREGLADASPAESDRAWPAPPRRGQSESEGLCR